MKAKQLGQFIEMFSEMLAQAGASAQARAWQEVASMFRAKPSANVKDICKAISAIAPSVQSGPIDAKALIEIWPAMKQHLSSCAKKQLTDDLQALIETIAPFASLSLTELSQKVSARLSTGGGAPQQDLDADLVPKYFQRLEAALGDDQAFSEVYDALKTDPRVKAADAKKLAREFTKRSAGSKADAFDRIWNRHASLVGAGARAKATGGRTAA